MRQLVKKSARIIKQVALGGLVACLCFVGWRFATHNEDVVLPGELYRSAQLDTPDLVKMIKANGIKTVINLRGKNAQAGWYIEETATCRELGVAHVDVRWSAQHLPPPAEVNKLLEAYRDMPRPILLHCRSGSDRTGLASSIFLIDQKNVPWQTASRALSWKYGHFAIYPYFEMDEFVQLYGQSGRPSLNDWAAHGYPETYATEMKETKWDEMTEPLELAIRGSL
jgi:protein tyrosine phosphatase (PTP) superfamily phosphohydrolase (DUF442 family)